MSVNKSFKFCCRSLRSERSSRKARFKSNPSSMTSESLISQHPSGLLRYRQLRRIQKLNLMAIFCSVGFVSPPGVAAPSLLSPLTKRDKRLLDILEASGRTPSDALLSEQHSLKNKLKREYLRQFNEPYAESILELALHYETNPKRDHGIAAQLQSSSIFQLGNNFETKLGWSVHALPNTQRLLPQEPSLAPRIHELTVGYGKLRTVELILGLPREFSILGGSELPSDFSGAAIKIHPLKDRIEPIGKRFEFEVEHGWAAPPLERKSTKTNLHIQRTRPRLSFNSSGKSVSLSGQAMLEWYTDPDNQLERLSLWRTRTPALPDDAIISNWRLFALNSELKFNGISETYGHLKLESVRNTLAPDSKPSWNATGSIGRVFRFSEIAGKAQLSLSIFEVAENSIPAGRLPPVLNPKTQGGVAELSIAIEPSGKRDSELKFELTYLQDKAQNASSMERLCQGSDIVNKSDCSTTALKLSWTTLVAPNL